MNWLMKVQRWGQKHAVANLYRYFVLGNIIGYVLGLLSTATGGRLDFIYWLEFSPYDILHGQIWRLVTWIVVPMQGFDVWAVLFMLCVLSWGASLENMVGTYRMNVLLVGGVLLSDLLGFVIYLVYYIVLGYGMPVYATTYYMLISILMAIAICMPEAEVRLWFVLPLRMKWMLVLEGGYIVYFLGRLFVSGVQIGGIISGLTLMLVWGFSAISAMLNLFLFFKINPGKVHLTKQQKARRREFRQQVAEPVMRSGAPRHKCAICGKTEQDDPELTFRFCSKCSGAKEYCQNHLFTHTHQ